MFRKCGFLRFFGVLVAWNWQSGSWYLKQFGSWSACALLGEHILKTKGTVPRKLGPTDSLNKLLDFSFHITL